MIEIRDLHKQFNDKIILNGINLNILTGETLCIIGKSGCGKSVLLKHIVGLLYPDSGSVKIDGLEVSMLSQKELFEVRKRVGYVFQGAALFDSFNVYENVILKLLENGEKDVQKLEKEAKFVLSSVGLLPPIEESNTKMFFNEWTNLSHKKPSELSGGMKKRVGVARALVGSPKYIFYDEPTTGLDPVTSQQIDSLILDLTNKLQVTSIVISHDMFSVENVADKVAMLHEGCVHWYGKSEEIKLVGDDVVREFLQRYE